MNNTSSDNLPEDQELKISHTSSPALDNVTPNEQVFGAWLQKKGGYQLLSDAVLRKLYTNYPNEIKIQAEQELKRRNLFGPDGKFIVFTPVKSATELSADTESQISSPTDTLPESGTIIVPHDGQ